MRVSALFWLYGLLAIALARNNTDVIEDIVNDVIKPNNGLFSDAVEQFGIVSFSPTPSAKTSVTPTISPSASVPSSVSLSSSPLASSSPLPSRAPSPAPSVSASPSTLASPVPSSEGRRPSSPDAREPSSSPSMSVSPTSSPSASISSSSTPTPSHVCQTTFSKTGTIGNSVGNAFDDTGALSATEVLTEIAISGGIDGIKFTTSDQILAKGTFSPNDRILTVPNGEPVRVASACSGDRFGYPAVTYLRFELSNGDFVESGSQPANGCQTFTAPPGAKIIGKFGEVSFFFDKIGFVIRSLCNP